MLAASGVLLTLAALTWFLVVPVLAEIGENARFLALLLEAPQRALEVLIVVNDDFGQELVSPLLGALTPCGI